MTWHFWDGTIWRDLTDDQLDKVQPPPMIIAKELRGSGSLGPDVRIAVGDKASVANVVAMHTRFRMHRW